MDAALIALWDRGVHISFKGEPFRTRQNIPNEDVDGVHFCDMHVCDRDIEAILSLDNLSSVALMHTTISGRSLELLAQLSKLDQLILSGPAITDASVTALLRMSTLEYLDVADTELTPAGREKLRAGLPNTEIRS